MATLALKSPKSEQVNYPVHDSVPAYGMQLACGPAATLLATLIVIALAVAMAFPLMQTTLFRWQTDTGSQNNYIRPDWLDLA